MSSVCILPALTSCRNFTFNLMCRIGISYSAERSGNIHFQPTSFSRVRNIFPCFWHPSHPTSGVHKTVNAASGTGHSIWETTFLQRGFSPLWRKVFFHLMPCEWLKYFITKKKIHTVLTNIIFFSSYHSHACFVWLPL